MKRASILLVEDDRVALDLLAEVLRDSGFEVRAAASGEEALGLARERAPQVVVTDLRLGAMDGLTLLREVRTLAPTAQVIVMTAFGSLETAVEAIRQGAFDYVSKPFRMEEMVKMVESALAANASVIRPPPDEPEEKGSLLGRSPAMTEVFKAIARVAPLRTSVLIQGETGTGKELVARAIHDASPRAERSYVTVNCASLPEGLLESELFGHRKGAFTGAAADRKGLFEAANGGTILLDEIGDMPLPVQAKLLRVLESGEIRPVGETSPRTVDVRVLAATHRDLARTVESGAFRQDLYFRLNAMTITVPPLADRLEDLPLLCVHFLRSHARAAGRSVPELTARARRILEGYSWPGNVRELSHILERAVALCRGAVVDAEELPDHLAQPGPSPIPANQTLDEVEKAHILSILKSVNGNRGRAASILGIDRKTLYRKLLRFGVQSDAPADGT
ncbi:MAG: sigma-54-dependent transcriptional regulator [Planctomycetota bacterium]|jgi:DNA-binding NtrC family response regulator